MTPKNQTLEGKNWTLGGYGGSKIVGHHLWMIPYLDTIKIYSGEYLQM